MTVRAWAFTIAALLTIPACDEWPGRGREAEGPAARGRVAVARYGCGSCHTIPKVRGADALVGPPLDRVGSRTYIAGVLANTPENMARWVQDPPGVDRLTAMPNLRVTPADASDITAFLSTLR